MKKLVFAGVVLLLLGVIGEILIRVVYYQIKGRSALALIESFNWLRDRVDDVRIESEVADVRPRMERYRDARRRLRLPEGDALRAELQARYETLFRELVHEVGTVRSKFLVIDFQSGADTDFGRFVAELTERCGVDHINLSSVLKPIPIERRQLIPADGHYTRYANHLVATLLAERLDAYTGYSSGRDYTGSPAILGDAFDCYGGVERTHVLNTNPSLASLLVRNSQGFRSTQDLEIPKKRQRVLFLGDSLTFGDHLNNQDTYVAMVGRLRSELEVVNAGISGYTILDQLELFRQRAKFAAPDVTVLQVCENDWIELTAFVRGMFRGKRGEAVHASETESQFLRGLK